MIRKSSVTFAVTVAALMFSLPARPVEYDLQGKIESLRQGNLITIIMTKKPRFPDVPVPVKEGETITFPEEFSDYLVLDGEHKVIGSARLVSAAYSSRLKGKVRVIARITLKRPRLRTQLRAGDPVVLVSVKEKLPGKFYSYDNEKIIYKRQITSTVDGRPMVLVPGGKFVFGFNRGRRDEYPEQVIALDDFYIDKYEVSNRDFKKYVTATNSRPPLSWKKGEYAENETDLPVLVTYYEALEYTLWAGTRLPSEQEWEKAARGTGRVDDEAETETIQYPWGNAFDPDRVNSVEFWTGKSIGMELTGGFRIMKKGYLPVYTFEGSGASPYGAVNMSGNAKEWTDSWYAAYKGNKFVSGKYGTQYKVVRGGAWYNDRKGVRVTVRETGGIPSLRSDNLAGFRCVRAPSILDRERESPLQ